MKRFVAILLTILMLFSLFQGALRENVVKANGNYEWVLKNQSFRGVEDVTSLAIDPKNPEIVYAGTKEGGVLKSTNGGKAWAYTALTGTPINCLAIDPKNTQTIYAGSEDAWSKSDGVFKSTDGGKNWTHVRIRLIYYDIGSGFWSYSAVYSLAIDPKNTQTIYAGTDIVPIPNSERLYGGVHKSTDGGKTWTDTGLAANIVGGYMNYHVNVLAIDPINPKIIYAGATYNSVNKYGIFKSVNGGGPWIETPINTIVNSLAIDPKNTQIIYAGADGGVLKSTNGGKTWTYTALTGTEIHCLAIDPKNTQIIYAGTERNSVFKSVNSGASWTEVNRGITYGSGISTGYEHFLCLAIDPIKSQTIYAGTEENGVFKSVNGGENWIVVTLRGSVSSLAIDPTNSQTIYVGEQEGVGIVFKSTDGGDSWAHIGGIGSSEVGVYSLAIDPTNSNMIYAGTWNYLYKSTDGGTNWTKVVDVDLTGQVSLAICPNTIYVGTLYGLLKSTNGGTNWSEIHSRGLGGDKGYFELYSLAIDPKNTPIIYAIISGMNLGTDVFKSTNGGANWTKVNIGLTGKISSLAIDPTNSQTVYVGVEGGGVFKSTNGGSSWTNMGLTDISVHCLAIDAKNPQIIYVGTDNGVYKYSSSSPSIIPPSSPQNLKATSSKSSITLTWTASQPGTYPVAGCAIYRGTSSGGEDTTPMKIVNSPTTTYTDSNLTAGTTYYYYVKAFDNQKPPNYSESSNEVNAIILNEEELINALTELRDAMLEKIDYDVDVTATAFADVKDYWRSKRWADLVRVPLRILEDALALPLKVKDFVELQKETNEKIREAGDLYHILSLIMMVNDLQEIGGKLATAIDGPSYSTVVEKMLNAADATYVPPIDPNWKEYYEKVIVNDLQGVGDEKPLAIQQKSTTSERETIAVAHGALEVRKNTAKNFNDLIDIINKDGLPSNFPLEKTVNWLKELKKEVVSSKLQDTDVEYQLLINGKTWHTKIKIGTVADWYKTFGNIAGILDKNLGIEQKVEILKAGESVICTVRYITTGTIEKDLGILQSTVQVGEISLEAQKKSFHSDPETEFYMVPQEMLMALPAELSDTWVIADDVNQQIRAYLQAKKIITLKIGSPNMIVNDISQGIDAQGSTPIIKNGRTLVPIRAIIEALGGSVSWDANERKVTVSLGSTTIELWIGKSTAKVNGMSQPIDSTNSKVVPEIINGRTMLPLRFVTENLGATIDWNPNTQTIRITYPGT